MIGKEGDLSSLSQNYSLLKTRLHSWSEQYKTSAIQLRCFLDPYFEKALNRTEDMEKLVRSKVDLEKKRAKQEENLRIFVMINEGG